MARYTGLFKVAASLQNFHQLVEEVLNSCNFSIVHQSGDYLMARESPGRIAYYQLVTVEILVDKTTATENEVHMHLVIKNEELPLQVNNHCQQMFTKVTQAIAEAQHWQLIEAVPG